MIYDKFADKYDRFFSPLDRLFFANWRAETLSYLPSAGKILEIGAGTGLNFPYYPKCQHAVAGEISLEMLKIARQKTTAVELIQADAEKLPFPENSFDAAFATLVFCSIPNPQNAFVELQRVVKPNGNVILLEHVRPSGLLGFGFDILNLLTVALIDDHFNRQTAQIAKNSGLEILSVKQKALGVVNLINCRIAK